MENKLFIRNITIKILIFQIVQEKFLDIFSFGRIYCWLKCMKKEKKSIWKETTTDHALPTKISLIQFNLLKY